jgi:hypothetical protein
MFAAMEKMNYFYSSINTTKAMNFPDHFLLIAYLQPVSRGMVLGHNKYKYNRGVFSK